MTEESLYSRRKRPFETAAAAAVYLASALSAVIFIGITGYVFIKGTGAISWKFLTSVSDPLKRTDGIAGNIINTVYIVGLTLAAAVPAGVGAAVYLNEYAGCGRAAALVNFAAETLSGLPSVIFGLFGMVFFGETLGLGYSLLSGALTLTFMVLPLIMSNTREALRSVPEGYRYGALGLGASRWRMIRTLVLPAAMPGILGGVVLAVGRIVGESAALLFTAGSSRFLPRLSGDLMADLGELGKKVMGSGGTLAVELYLQIQNGNYRAAFATACVLMAALMCLNLVFRAFGRMKKMLTAG